jgi:hypothetical protein
MSFIKVKYHIFVKKYKSRVKKGDMGKWQNEKQGKYYREDQIENRMSREQFIKGKIWAK